jgi:beta/gamma crystallin
METTSSAGRIYGGLLLMLGLLPAAPVAAQGVTLFRDRDLRGPSMTFYDDAPDLRYTAFGSRRASSIAVPPGCTAVLYERPRFGGRSTVFRDGDNNLSNTAVGEDTASSMRVNCRGSYPGWRPPDEDRPPYAPPAYRPPWADGRRRGAMLFRDRELRGPSEFFSRDVPDLDRTRFGSRMASSIDVSPGCVAILFELPGFRGRRTEFRERDNNLKNTAVGEDTASSLRVLCR